MKHDEEMIINHSKILALIPLMVEDVKLLKDRLVIGNGKPGLITQHAELNTSYTSHLKQHNDISLLRRWFLGVMIAIMLACTGCVYEKYNEDTKKILHKIEWIEKQIINYKGE